MPDYKVRTSRKARCARLSVSPAGQVEIVVPVGFNCSLVPEFLEKHRQWLEGTLADIQDRRYQHQGDNDSLPTTIRFLPFGETWTVSCVVSDANRVTGRQSSLLVKAVDEVAMIKLLRSWLTRNAKNRLGSMLHSVSEEIGLPFRRVSIRAQKTRWGSCSSRCDINLNRALMFLPPDIVRYVLIHELCHTVHLNHSRAYWSLVKNFYPNYRDVDRALRYGWCYVPQWALPK
ncbi:MAG: M48 family metallopeptidase [Gammaproteobacteria bacterium]|nr:M48 family metallopeptidase [Gammaproteobacteria bacterium]